MSMYRAGLALMSSLTALAGLFILLDADLLAAVQVMMNVGGMLVMILFMVMAMMDPGGEMMWEIKRTMGLRGLGAFSMRMPRENPPAETHVPQHIDDAETYTCPMHSEIGQAEPGRCPKCGMELVSAGKQDAHGNHGPEQSSGGGHEAGHMSPQQHHRMMVDMAMSTTQLPWALLIGAASAGRARAAGAAYPVAAGAHRPDRGCDEHVGELLLSRYMIAFEGAAFFILAGIAAAVIFGKREQAPGSAARIETAEPESGLYTCPMHPEIRERQPGQCPKCGMDLVSAGNAATHEHGGHR